MPSEATSPSTLRPAISEPPWNWKASVCRSASLRAEELGVVIPYHALTSPDQWKLDLAGLAISFNAPGVSIAGAFLKDAGPPIEYSGMLLMKLDEFGFLAVGAYSRPQEGDDTYTSL